MNNHLDKFLQISEIFSDYAPFHFDGLKPIEVKNPSIQD